MRYTLKRVLPPPPISVKAWNGPRAGWVKTGRLMAIAPMSEQRRARRRAGAFRRDEDPLARHEARENGGEGRRPGEAALDDKVARRFEALKQMRRHQRRVEGSKRRPP